MSRWATLRPADRTGLVPGRTETQIDGVAPQRNGETVAQLHTEVIGQFAPDDRFAGAESKPAGDDLFAGALARPGRLDR